MSTQPCKGTPSADGTICAVNHDPGASEQQIQHLAEQAARERAALIDYLGNDVGPITVIVRDEGNARHKPQATIFIPSRQIAKRYAITAHEITHFLTQGWASLVLKEGLAVYVKFHLGEQQGWPNYRRPVHAAARHWIENNATAIRSPTDAEAALQGRRKGQRQKLLATYSVSGSWVMWLLEKKFSGDIQRFLTTLYRSGDYRVALNERDTDLYVQWRAYLNSR